SGGTGGTGSNCDALAQTVAPRQKVASSDARFMSQTSLGVRRVGKQMVSGALHCRLQPTSAKGGGCGAPAQFVNPRCAIYNPQSALGGSIDHQSNRRAGDRIC